MEELIAAAIVLAIIIGLMSFFQNQNPPNKNSSNKKSDGESNSNSKPNSFRAIADKFETLEEVQSALIEAGLESSNLILGIDFTKSNEYTGRKSFGGRSMHGIYEDRKNPYQQVIEIVGKALEPFDDDKLIPSFGFGDMTTTDKTVFPFFPNRPCHTFAEVLTRYSEIAPKLKLSGPTSFAPIIHQAINIVKEEKSYHILVIVADGQVTNERETISAIVEASKYPLSIILIGVGDGPWEMMREFDDHLPHRSFDNFQFVNFTEMCSRFQDITMREVQFAVAALQEIPDQFKEIKKLHLL